MGWFDSAFDWVGDNFSDIAKVVGAGINTVSGVRANDAAARESQRINDEALRNYQGNRDAYLAWAAQNDAINQENAAARAAASGRTAAARNAWGARVAAAKAQEERNRQRAEKRANKQLNTTFEDVKGVYEPYMAAGREALPIMTKAYASGGDLLDMATSAIKANPTALSMSKPASAVNIPNMQSWMISPMSRAMR